MGTPSYVSLDSGVPVRSPQGRRTGVTTYTSYHVPPRDAPTETGVPERTRRYRFRVGVYGTLQGVTPET